MEEIHISSLIMCDEIQKGNIDVNLFKYVYQKCPNPTKEYNGCQLLGLACMRRIPSKYIKALIECGANVHKKTHGVNILSIYLTGVNKDDKSKIDNEIVKLLIDEGIDVNCVYNDQSPLHHYLQSNGCDLDTVNAFISAGANTKYINGYCCNALMTYLTLNPSPSASIVSALIKGGCNVNQIIRDKIKNHNLITYVYRNTVNLPDDILTTLYDLGLDPLMVERNNHNILLVYLLRVEFIRPDVLRLFHRYGVNFQIKSADQKSVIMAALSNPSTNSDVLKTLIDCGALCNSKSNFRNASVLVIYILLCSPEDIDPDIISLMIEKGANINFNPIDYFSPLTAALFKRHGLPVIKALVEAGANLNYLNPHRQNSFSMYLYPFFPINISYSSTSVQLFASLDYQDFEGSNFKITDCEMLRYLASKGADVNVKDIKKFTPLFSYLNIGVHQFSGLCDTKVLDTLVELGVKTSDLYTDKEGYISTPLMYYLTHCSNPDPLVISTLVNLKVDINYECPKSHLTALHISLSSTHSPQIIYTLLELGARPKGKWSFPRRHKQKSCKVDITTFYLLKVFENNEKKRIPINVLEVDRVLSLLVSYGATQTNMDLQYMASFRPTYFAKYMFFFSHATTSKMIQHQKFRLQRYLAVNNKTTRLSYLSCITNTNTNTLNRVANDNFSLVKQLNNKVYNILTEYRDENDSNMLMSAAKSSDLNMVNLIIRSGGDVNQKDKFGMTALMYNCKYNPSYNIIEVLLSNGADIFSKNTHELTALDYLAKYDIYYTKN